MRLVKFSVTNFRSITSAHKIPIAETTVLIGCNNEGKSNILKALSFAMNALQDHALREKRRGILIRRPYYKGDDNHYFWQRDFPITLQTRKSVKQTIFKLEFLLTEEEIYEFKEQIKSNLNGTLPIEIRIGEDNRPIIKVSKTGRGAKTLNAKSAKIADFVAKRIFFNYIPVIRTDKEALVVISQMLGQELRILEDHPEYKKAIQVINDLQKPILKNLSERIKESLSEFLPNIKDVNIDISASHRRIALRRDFEVIINDGTPTNIEFKGDGVKSLAALGLLKNRNITTGISIIAIEEPESHLHPAAIHQLNEIVCSLSDKNQVIITTHNPLFVDRINIKSNVIIEKGKASSAKNIRQIRELLGIKASDNLMNANYTLVVEGDEDKIALLSILSSLSKKISKSIKSNFFAIEPIGGAGNLSYKLSLLRNSLCIYHVLLDHDEAGRKAFDIAKEDKLIDIKNCTFTNCLGMPNSEFEDCIDPKVYKDEILRKYGVDINSPKFRGNQKWSQREKVTTFPDSMRLPSPAP